MTRCEPVSHMKSPAGSHELHMAVIMGIIRLSFKKLTRRLTKPVEFAKMLC